jgi:hypothetical protein
MGSRRVLRCGPFRDFDSYSRSSDRAETGCELGLAKTP